MATIVKGKNARSRPRREHRGAESDFDRGIRNLERLMSDAHIGACLFFDCFKSDEALRDILEYHAGPNLNPIALNFVVVDESLPDLVKHGFAEQAWDAKGRV